MKSVSTRAVLVSGLVMFGIVQHGHGQGRVISPDSTFAFELPEGFAPMQLNTEAELQFANAGDDQYFLVLTESKKDMFGWNLTRHSMITFAQILRTTDFPVVVGPTALELDGYDARQYELQGVIQGTQVAYAHTSIDLPVEYVQVLVWTPRSRWDSSRVMFQEIMGSFEVLAGSAEGPLPPSDVFDIVPGTWAWMSRETGCDSNTQTFSIARDRQTMKIVHSKPFENSAGDMTDVTNYVIEGSGPRILNTFIPGETRLTDEGDPVKWDLVVVARNRIAWHRTDWASGGLTGPLMRCVPGS